MYLKSALTHSVHYNRFISKPLAALLCIKLNFIIKKKTGVCMLSILSVLLFTGYVFKCMP